LAGKSCAPVTRASELYPVPDSGASTAT
jgi:hypothetical protein